jgi:hypothetical protein
MKTIPPRPSQPIHQTDTSADARDVFLTPLGRRGRTAKPRREILINWRGRDRHGTSMRAPSLLTQQSVFAPTLPRFHVKPKWVDGTLMVYDRASDEEFRVYTPRFASQFLTGHRYGLWYLRIAGDVGLAPRSHGFPTPGDAIEALQSGCWRPSTPPPDRPHARCRVIWS